MLEKQPIHLGYKFYYSETVPEASANLGLGEFYRISNRDHINICKPESRDSVVYTLIRDLIKRIIEHEMSDCQLCKKRNEAQRDRRLGEFFYEIFKLNYFY